MDNLTKEDIVKKQLFPYIPFYIARYEKELVLGDEINSNIIRDLEYFRDEMVQLHNAGALSDDEIIDLMGFVNTIITHITNGNQNEERLVGIMGGTVIETESEKLIRQGMKQGINQGKAQMIIEMGQEEGLDDWVILKRLQDKAGVSLDMAALYLQQYGKTNWQAS